MSVIDGAIRLVAIAASVIVAAGFLMFAVDQSGSASERQQSVVAGDQPGQTTTQTEHTGVRGAIEDANRALLAPFAVQSSNPWAARGVPTLLALLVYGVGLGFLARWIRARA